MLFHEIYGCYYNAVAAALALAVKGELTEKKLKSIADEKAFSESFLEIIPALKDERWKLLREDFSSPIKHIPEIPLTDLQKKWLKAISLDERIRLFDADFSFLDGVEPLFLPEDYIIFDKYNDGDDFSNEEYIGNFRTVLKAVKEHGIITLDYRSNKGTNRRFTCAPYEIEYSEKDDKFRVNILGYRYARTLNMAGISNCEIVGGPIETERYRTVHSEEYLVAELYDERNALERFLLHFAHFRKEAEQPEDGRYRIKIFYDKSDETELLIRLLSFGPFVKVCEPQSFVEQIKDRLKTQMERGLK